jgi:hypothetical protein
MSHWNHRAVRRVYPGVLDGEASYSIHEVYYGLGGIKPSITVGPDYPYGETVAELREDLERMLRALDKPVLDYETREEITDGT